jgi:dihydrolipoamide dehydrogenase
MDDSYTYKISATHIIIATGSKTAKLPIPGLDKSAILDSTSILDMVELPKSLTIIGGGVIGMEFAFIYANFGVKVNVVEYLDKILVNLDDDLIERIEHAAKEKNISLYTGAKVKEIKESVQNEMITVFEEEGQEKYIISEKILAAVGRIPNIDGLNVENINIRLNENGKGIMVNDKMQTNVEHIYAIGDVNNKIQLAHAASNQGMIAIDAIIGKNRSLKELSLVPSVIFTTPEVAMVGKTEKQLKKDNHTYKVSKFPYATNGKALSMSKTEGFIKLIYDDTEEKLCGAAIVGEDASNLISSLCIAVQNNLTVEQLSDVIYPHPTLGEMLQEAALGLTIGAIHSHE